MKDGTLETIKEHSITTSDVCFRYIAGRIISLLGAHRSIKTTQRAVETFLHLKQSIKQTFLKMVTLTKVLVVLAVVSGVAYGLPPEKKPTLPPVVS